MTHYPTGIHRFLHVLLAIFLATVISFASLPLLPYAGAQTATNVTVTSATITVNGTGTTDVFVNGVSGERGLGAYDLRIDFDRTKVNAANVLGGTAPFSSEPTNNITAGPTTAANNTGKLNFNAFHAVLPGPTGNIKVATIAWRALAEGTHPLTLTIVTLADTNGANITGAAVVSGTITVPPGPPGQPTAPPQATPAPTTPPPPPPATGAPTTPPAAPTTPPPPGATPQPTTPPGAPVGTAVEIGSATVAPGASAQIPVTVKNFTATSGFGSYDFELTFRPEIIKIDSVRAGDQPFGDPAASNISNTSGKVFLNDFIAQVPGPRGNITVATLVVTGVAGGTSPITLKITTLSAADGADIAATVVNGNVTVSGGPVPGTATPPPPTVAPTTPPPPPPPTAKPTTPPAKPTTPPPPKPTPKVTSPAPPKPTITVAPPTAKPTTPAPTPTPTPPPSGPSLPLIIGIIVVVIAIIVVVVITRKKPTSPE